MHGIGFDAEAGQVCTESARCDIAADTRARARRPK